MKIDRIAGYSTDFKGQRLNGGKHYCTVPIDFDFAMNCPDMENRVYYKKQDADGIKDRLNYLGIWLMAWYDLRSMEVLEITIKFDAGCAVSYKEVNDMETITNRLIKYKGQAQY